ncbi:hypothetical protein ACP46_gp64 [Rhizobium phage RHEph06]|uniref:Uncharacterized protein n=4 Tax=Kleczkowskavirus RHEph4 TaxID=1921526 RepID=A0A7S5UU26_9CAUD|nr:hypothetical protein ACP46_gp64 [Rhizobium phage RHEph06]YP_009598505.1 hypothetical protein FDH25_gp63 [Rhizobium phage RHEph04]AGC35825.1 hypothetical protein RHEph05_gp058 [Rhizobium phage RHEph05]QIG67688.1 hypothetical protein EVB51_071 [Rhizobium phage RHph_Y17]QIG69007.1 hypothetical protein EVB73_071 [Rhizobium phage RHph_Y3_43]QIG69556.1 hypothetical protein EVB80_073 [Rhizobium phage RHph_I36]QIG75430.1 hypothetical protein EVC17_073 [Rhizobium phage RHph_Y1_1]QIG75980.1 hypothe
MTKYYATRGQVARFAKRQNIHSFWSVNMPGFGWKLVEMPGDDQLARDYAAAQDFVSHVEIQHIDEGRKPGYEGVLIVTCLKSELPEGIPFRCEPITPSLWAEGAADNFEHRARSSTVAGPRAKSDAESPVKTVWRIADEMVGQDRKAVIAACVAAGVNPSTASTQYYKWNKERK